MMPLHLPPRSSSVLVSALAAGAMLALVSCSGRVTPLGPDAAATTPPLHRLGTPLVLRDVRTQPNTLGGGCPAGYAETPGSPGACHGRKTGGPVTITSAGISQVSAFQPPSPQGQQPASVQYGLWITVSAAEVSAVATVIPAASGHPRSPSASPVTGPAATSSVSVSVGGRTWAPADYTTRPAGREFAVFLPNRNQALQLRRALDASG